MNGDQIAQHEYEELVKSYGGKAVGLTFNPSGLLAVRVIKVNYAEIINELNLSRVDIQGKETKDTEDGERLRLLSIAITETQAAQMWAVKALTWGDK